MPRKKKRQEKNYHLKVRPMVLKKKDDIESVFVRGFDVSFHNGAIEGEYTHLEILDENGETVYVIPAYRLLSIEDTNSVETVATPKSNNVMSIVK